MPIEHPYCRRWSWPVVRNRESSFVICFPKRPSESAILTKPDIRMCVTIYPSVFVFLTAGWLDHCIRNYLRQTKWPVSILFVWLSDVYWKKHTGISSESIFYLYLCTAIRRKTGSICCEVNVEIYSKRQIHSPAPAMGEVFSQKATALTGVGFVLLLTGFPRPTLRNASPRPLFFRIAIRQRG